MGADLFWMKTPKPQDEEKYDLYYSTWHVLVELYKKEDKRELDGFILTTEDVGKLETLLITFEARARNNEYRDIKELISAIEKHGSITLIVKE